MSDASLLDAVIAECEKNPHSAKAETDGFVDECEVGNESIRSLNKYSHSIQSPRALTENWYILDVWVMIGAVSGKSSLENIACAHLKKN